MCEIIENHGVSIDGLLGIAVRVRAIVEKR